MSINITQLKQDFDTAGQSYNEQTADVVAHFTKRTYTGKKQFYAILCQAMEAQGIKPETPGTAWEDMTDDQRSMRTIYSQVCTQLELK